MLREVKQKKKTSLFIYLLPPLFAGTDDVPETEKTLFRPAKLPSERS